MLCSFWFAFPDHCVNLKLYICSEGIDWKVSFLDSSSKMLVLRRRTEVFFEYLDSQNRVSVSIDCLISSIEVSIGISQLLANLQVEKLSIVFLATETWWSEKSERCYVFWFNSMFQLRFLWSYRFDILDQNSERFLWNCD